MPELKVLTLIDYYLPGYKAGGPIRTLANMVDKLGDEFHFKIITGDRDIFDQKAYSGIRVDDWNRVDKEEVFYLSPPSRSMRYTRELLSSTDFNIYYLNSFFSIQFTVRPLLLRRLKLIPDKPLILAPRGELSQGALGLKRMKKWVYLTASRAFGLYRGVNWQASSKFEEADIRRWFGKDVPVVIAPNIPPRVRLSNEILPKGDKSEGHLRIVFLSRLSRKKNLASALKMLQGINGKISFNIYGPLEDKAYWVECEEIIESLPDNIEVRYYGSIAHDKVGKIFREHDLFFFPTLGENFGHVILEALCAGCPVLISDQTPWRDLEEKGIGWDLPLRQHALFRTVLQRCVDMNPEEYREMSDKAREYGLEVVEDERVVERNRKLFSGLISED